MASSISGIPLFDYNGQYRTARPLNTSASFRTAQTDFTPSITVNGSVSSTQASRLMQPTLGVNNQGQMQQIPQSSLNELLSFGASSLSRQTDLTVDGVTRAYQDFMGALSISEQNYSQLLNQDSFSVFNGKVGFNVTTDGQGNVAQVSLLPSSNDLRTGTPSNPTLPNRAEITQRAESRQANELPPLNFDQPLQGQSKQRIFLQDNAANKLQDKLSFEDRLAIPKAGTPKPLLPGITESALLKPSVESANNPLLEKLLRLQPRDMGIPVFGPESQINSTTAKQLGAVNGSFGVRYSESLQENLALLRDRLAQEALQSAPQRVTKAREGLMPLSPFVPSEPSMSQQSLFGSGGFLEQLSTSVDTTEKKSSGGYIPFQTGGEHSNGQQNPQQQYPRPRTPLRVLA